MTRRIVVLLVYGLIAALLQGTVLRSVLPPYLVPNLVLIGIVYLGLFDVSIPGLLTAFALGLQLDLFSATLLGPWAGAAAIVCGLLALIAQRIFLESVTTIMLAVFTASLVANTVCLALLYQFRPVENAFALFSFVEAFATALVAPAVFMILRKLTRAATGSGRNPALGTEPGAWSLFSRYLSHARTRER